MQEKISVKMSMWMKCSPQGKFGCIPSRWKLSIVPPWQTELSAEGFIPPMLTRKIKCASLRGHGRVGCLRFGRALFKIKGKAFKKCFHNQLNMQRMIAK